MDIREFVDKFLGISLNKEQWKIIDTLIEIDKFNKQYYKLKNSFFYAI